MAFHALTETDQKTWYVDIGCSNHMRGYKSSFVNLDESFHSCCEYRV